MRDALRQLVGESASMRAVRRQLAALGPLATTVLVTGETGVGKGVAARVLHGLARRRGPWVHADCASLSRSLFESEIFGHERGAFTGALARRVGRFERAAQGTLFLDEIGELDLPQQAALLHVLQDRCFERVGGREPLAMSARVVAATSRDLHHEVGAGRFRPDLYFRVAVARIALPPLRERPEDVAPLARHALAAIRGRLDLEPPLLTREAFECLATHPWPGNVRELENALERLAIRCPGRPVAPADVQAVLEETPGAPALAAPCCRGVPGDRISQALSENGGNVARAARQLGLARTTLRRRIDRLGLRSDLPDSVDESDLSPSRRLRPMGRG